MTRTAENGAGARLARITVFPVKSLDGTAVESATVLDGGGLSLDREYAIVDADGEYVNGKRTAAVHRVEAAFDPATGDLSVDAPALDPATFRLPDERAAAGAWLSEHFGHEVRLVRDATGGFPDDADASGPTVVSTATLRAVAGWFDGIDAAGMRRRLRANLEVADVPAFWEDRLYGPPGEPRPFRVGPATFEGTNPCRRCVVPSRDPDTGEETPGFARRLAERREATLPDWAARGQFDTYVRLMVNTRVPPATVGAEPAVGDPVVPGERAGGPGR